MMLVFYIIIYYTVAKAEPLHTIDLPHSADEFNITLTRRIINGHDVGDTRPYMVYLRPAPTTDFATTDNNWMCGGVIIHERYILTSAACIENVKHFYIISGTHRYVPFSEKHNECVNNGAKKAIWKCVPKSYVYDGGDFDNIRWMNGDIAVVKTEDDFNFHKRIRGCDFIPKKVAYNNETADYEKPGTHGSIAGWGTTEKFGDTIIRDSTSNSPTLLETDVLVLSKRNCKKRWPERYHYIIDQSMICGKDGTDTDVMSAACSEREVNCKELLYSDENEDDLRKVMPDLGEMSLHTAGHFDTRRSKIVSGGFCENDHGGPLVVGYGKTSIVVGVISACMTKEITHKCYGPFLYTSVWRYRHLISCAIDKEIGEQTCRRLLRSDKTLDTTFDWSGHPDGPPKSENIARNVQNTSPSLPPLPIFNASQVPIGF